jgi:hypothetical protein
MPPPMPCTARKAIGLPAGQARPQSAEPPRNRATEIIMAHWTLGNVAWKSRPSASRATLVIVMSSDTASEPTSRMPATFTPGSERRIP